VKLVKDHFLKLLITALFAMMAWAGNSITENSSSTKENKLHIEYIKEDLHEIKHGITSLLER